MPSSFALPQRPRSPFTKLTDFELKGVIGAGALSRVYLAIHSATGQNYAIKKISLSQLTKSDLTSVEKELQIHTKLSHERILKLYDFFLEGRSVYLVLEYCKRGSLFSYLNQEKRIGEIEAMRLFQQICEGIVYLHSQGYLHRDVKLENLLLSDDNSVKICDFGWSCDLAEIEYRKVRAGTCAYMSPESLTMILQDELSDVWSLGVVFYELLSGKKPYSGISLDDQLLVIKYKKINFSKLNIGEEVQRLVSGILQIDKSKRPSLDSILHSTCLINQSHAIYSVDDTGSAKSENKLITETSQIDLQSVDHMKKMDDNDFDGKETRQILHRDDYLVINPLSVCYKTESKSLVVNADRRDFDKNVTFETSSWIDTLLQADSASNYTLIKIDLNVHQIDHIPEVSIKPECHKNPSEIRGTSAHQHSKRRITKAQSLSRHKLSSALRKMNAELSIYVMNRKT